MAPDSSNIAVSIVEGDAAVRPLWHHPGVKVALPLQLTAVAIVGTSVEAPIFVAIILLFAVVAYFGAARAAWTKSSLRR
jgi:ABC-type multidrug transport system permease subunit